MNVYSQTFLKFAKPDLKTLKKNKTVLTDEERQKAMDAGATWHHAPDQKPSCGIWKGVVKGKTWFACHTHRAYAVRPTLAGAIKAFEFIKTTS